MAKSVNEPERTREVDTFEPVGDQHMEPVNGGRVRRIVFDGSDPEPEDGVVEFHEVEHETQRVYRPRHDAPIDAIHKEIDHLHRARNAPPAPRPAPQDETVYATGKGDVRASFQFVDRSGRRAFYTSVDKGNHQEDKRFSVSDVDKVIAGVALEEVVFEEDTEPAQQAKPTKARKAKAAKAAKPVKAPKAAKAAKAKPVKAAAPVKVVKPKKAKQSKSAKPAKPALPTDYKGDVHLVVDLEGIGPTYEKKLHAAKITNTQELLFTGDKRLQNVTGAPAKTVRNWKAMSQLVKIKGIGPQFAELMVRAGIDGIDGLKAIKPEDGVTQIKAYEKSLKSNVTGSGIGIKRLTAWQAEAKKMRKVQIDVAKIEVVALESRAAQATGAAAVPITCAAYTKGGDSCRNAPRDGSKYCASHKGYRAPSKAQLAANAKSA